jgi:hypothetical protein
LRKLDTASFEFFAHGVDVVHAERELETDARVGGCCGGDRDERERPCGSAEPMYAA